MEKFAFNTNFWRLNNYGRNQICKRLCSGASSCESLRAGIIEGWLPIGKATKNGAVITDIKQMDSRYGRISYYISPKLLYEETGYVWDGEKA